MFACTGTCMSMTMEGPVLFLLSLSSCSILLFLIFNSTNKYCSSPNWISSLYAGNTDLVHISKGACRGPYCSGPAVWCCKCHLILSSKVFLAWYRYYKGVLQCTGCCNFVLVDPVDPSCWFSLTTNVRGGLQNETGGSATYERTRSYPWLEVKLHIICHLCSPALFHFWESCQCHIKVYERNNYVTIHTNTSGFSYTFLCS